MCSTEPSSPALCCADQNEHFSGHKGTKRHKFLWPQRDKTSQINTDAVDSTSLQTQLVTHSGHHHSCLRVPLGLDMAGKNETTVEFKPLPQDNFPKDRHNLEIQVGISQIELCFDVPMAASPWSFVEPHRHPDNGLLNLCSMFKSLSRTEETNKTFDQEISQQFFDVQTQIWQNILFRACAPNNFFLASDRRHWEEGRSRENRVDRHEHCGSGGD